jgi:hypothetical protein
LAIANCYDVDMEAVINAKEEINKAKYYSAIAFEEER